MKLDFEQRQRAIALEDEIDLGDFDGAADEIIGLRDIIATITAALCPMTHPETGKPIGFHMCIIRDEDLPLMREIAANGVVRGSALGKRDE